MRAFLPLVALSSLAQVAQALYFYIDGSTMKCFYEELPKDTLVVGHYTAEEYDDQRHAWWKHDGISIFITVDVRLSREHMDFVHNCSSPNAPDPFSSSSCQGY